METASIAKLSDLLPQLSANDAAAARLLFDTRFHQLIRQYCPDLRIERTNKISHEALIQLSLGTHEDAFNLLIPENMLPSMASIVGARGWPQSLKLKCLWTMLSTEWTGIASLLERLGWSLLSAKRCQENPEGFGIAFLAHHGTQQTSCLIKDFSAQMWKQLDDQGVLSPYAYRNISGVNHLETSLIFSVRRLAWSAIRSLQIGDAVVLQKHNSETGGHCHVQLAVGCAAGQRAYRHAAWDGEAVILQGERWMSTEQAVETISPRADESNRECNLADVDVDVQLELQLVTMPIGALSAMQPGYVLELPVSVENAEVCLVIGGRVVGYAQLIRVADRLAARITRLKNDANCTVPD
jgi:flagellar motor switch/type III secretory pathway protein FliN